MSVVLQLNGQYIGQVFPNVKVVDVREEININCIFLSQAAAEGAMQLVRTIKGFKEAVFATPSFDQVPSKYSNIIINDVPHQVFSIIHGGAVCGLCGIKMPSVDYIQISTRRSTVIETLCPFCCIKIGDTAQDIVTEIPAGVKNEYFAHIVEQGIGVSPKPPLDDLPF